MSIRPRFAEIHDHPYPKHAKIVATLGPASDSPEMIERLINAGVNVFRLNFSHGNLDDQLTRMQRVRAAAVKLRTPIAVMGDLQGPKMRVTKVPDLDGSGGLMLETGTDILFRRGLEEAELAADGADHAAAFGVTFESMFTDVEPGQRVLVNDGAIRMLIVDLKKGEEVRCRVTHGGKISSGKGVNMPETELSMPSITPRDWECVEWGVRHGVDVFALSFVRTADEVMELKNKLKGMCSIDPERGADPLAHDIPVITKVEKPQAVANLEEIVRATDGVMVARGDLGVEMDSWHVPVAQKHIVSMCADYGKPCIVATQMLETMVTEPIPTRAEASDVANAIFDGADAVMLSAETAVGKHPDLVVETMARIIRSSEDWIDQQPHEPHDPKNRLFVGTGQVRDLRSV
jgi:pyruvate kinase